MPAASAVPSLLILPRHSAGQHRLNLVCFPYAGANPYIFIDWRTRFAPHVDVVGIHLPGRGTRLQQPSHTSISEIVSEVFEALPVLGGGPFAFYGHSLGALVAFETARQLRRMGAPQPSHLFVGGARPPHMPALQPPLHSLERQAFLDSVQARYGGIPAAILQERELLEIFLPALRADFAAYETYEHRTEPPLACPISAFAGDKDALVTADLMAEWSRHTRSGFELQVLSGDHFFLSPRRDELIAKIQKRLPIAR